MSAHECGHGRRPLIGTSGRPRLASKGPVGGIAIPCGHCKYPIDVWLAALLLDASGPAGFIAPGVTRRDPAKS